MWNHQPAKIVDVFLFSICLEERYGAIGLNLFKSYAVITYNFSESRRGIEALPASTVTWNLSCPSLLVSVLSQSRHNC